MRNISWPVLTLMGPVYTNGSEYFANNAAGSLETGMPLLFAPLNWNLGATSEKIGAIACTKNIQIETFNLKLTSLESLGKMLFSKEAHTAQQNTLPKDTSWRFSAT